MVFVVAEIGANWKGNVVKLARMVERCADIDVDAVKFQALSPELLARHPEWDWYKDASINEHNIEMVNKVCVGNGIEWFCTPTYRESVFLLDRYVKRWKIRHADNRDEELITACGHTGKPIILSTDRPIEGYGKAIQQIYCIPKYPTEFGELNFDMIKRLKGYSNHCLDPLACLKAVRHGAEYLEFHLTDDKADFAIDNKVSFSYSQMEEIMNWINIHRISMKIFT